MSAMSAIASASVAASPIAVTAARASANNTAAALRLNRATSRIGCDGATRKNASSSPAMRVASNPTRAPTPSFASQRSHAGNAAPDVAVRSSASVTSGIASSKAQPKLPNHPSPL